jgi:hypothetical protein
VLHSRKFSPFSNKFEISFFSQKILSGLLFLEIVNMETFAERSVADLEVDLEHIFVCIRYCINCTVTIRQIEQSAVIGPLKIKDILL